MAGTGIDDRNRDTTLGGTGGVLGTGSTTTGSGLDRDSSTRDSGLTGTTTTGSGLSTDKRDAGIVGGVAGQGVLAEEGRSRGGLGDESAGSGLSGTQGTGLGSSSTGAGLDSSTTGTGLGSSNTGTGLGGSSASATGGGLSSSEGRYVEGSERHHRGDGHPEDIVHEGPHVTGTAKALDPHLN